MENITSNYDALQTAAEKATKGSWINVGAWVENEHDDLKDICDCRPNGNEDYEQALRDAAYIALANPDTILRLLRDHRAALEATSQHPMQASVAAIQYALDADEGFEWLSLWNEGEFERCRRDWPDAPDDCYIGADPTHPETQRRLAERPRHDEYIRYVGQWSERNETSTGDSK
ncbi:ead/Ea22-like family protein [Burkholderia sp. BCC1630]|uniref:ead/Ea22-like family protein n=1 Tax=Burkholderia sp. BCC1630 TaxID=2676304 RepID=UPI00158D30C3|nr:ead/Ea22-like family protein [Burkholderia sp. BCC1630]